MSETITLPLHHVLIDAERGSTTLSVDVPKHEIAVLNVVHRGRVRDMGDADDEIELNIDADAELARMQRKYHRKNDQDPVRFAYPNGADAMRKFGFEFGRGGNVAAPQSLVRKHPKPKKADAKKADK